jgi:hypothetical protein
MIDLSGGTSTATVRYSNSELLARIAGTVAEAALPTLAPSGEPPKGALKGRETAFDISPVLVTAKYIEDSA